jgi:hypothetical protein
MRSPRCADMSSSGTRKAARRVTIVASISRAGMLRQHAHGKISQANILWERSMQFEKQLSEDRSAFALVEHRDQTAIFLRYPAAEAGARPAGQPAGSRSPVRSDHRIDRPLAEDGLTNDDGAMRTSSGDVTSWRAIPVAVSGLIARAAAGFAACADVAFPSFLIAVMSWTFAQTLAGCAAYAEAMYPGFVDSDDRLDGRDRVCGTQSGPGNPDQLQSRTSRLSEISSIAKDEIRGRSPIARRGDHCE